MQKLLITQSKSVLLSSNSLALLSLLLFQLGFSQSEELLRGKITGRDYPIERADIINYSTQKATVSNANGVFTIWAKPNDILLIYHKNYVERKVVLSTGDFKPDSFIVILSEKPVELQEVVIDNKKYDSFGLSPAEKQQIDYVKGAPRAKVMGVNDGSIANGVDFVALGKGAFKAVKGMLSKDKKAEEKIPKTTFKQFVTESLSEDYFSKNLNIDTKDLPSFLDFCGNDPNSVAITGHRNILAAMEFMQDKNKEFQKLLLLAK